MDISKITVQLRPRSQWEAIDMGVVVARKWFFRLWLTWLVTALPFLPICLGAALVIPGDTSLLFLIFFWFLKPLYEPPLLHWVSRILFDEKLAPRQAIREIRSTTSWKRIFAVWRSRFSPLRSFTMPVLLLEGMTGKDRKARTALLSRGYETALYLSLSCSCIECILTMSLATTFYWLIPEELRWIDFGDFIFLGDAWFTIALYVLACSLLAPFYICSGFFLYLSRRVELEAWDLEIGFKQINRQIAARRNRKPSVTTTLLLAVVFSFTLKGTPCMAQPTDTFSPQEAKEIINEVLKDREFGEKKTVNRWVPKEKEKKEVGADWLKIFEPFFEALFRFTKKAGEFLGDGSRYLVWICAGGLIAFLLLRYKKISGWLEKYLPEKRDTYTPPARMFGMDIRPDSLPDDIEEECKKLLKQGKKRDALSLLYRGALSRLINQHKLFIPSSFTENECRFLVKEKRPEPESAFFSELTLLWLATAYAHREPAVKPCLDLIEQWDSLYGERT